MLRKGTEKQVAQKSGLNRAILDGSLFELRRQLQYKTEWRGGLFHCRAAAEHQPHLPGSMGRMRSAIGRQPQDPGEVGVPEMRSVSQCGFDQCGKYPRGVASLSATLACSKCVVAVNQPKVSIA